MAFGTLNSILSTTVSITYTCCCAIVLMFANGSQINAVKNMKREILEIADNLSNDAITPQQAQTLLLRLFAVSGSLPLADLKKRLDEALDKETPETLNKWLEEKRK